jgi:hypothetical protein
MTFFEINFSGFESSHGSSFFYLSFCPFCCLKILLFFWLGLILTLDDLFLCWHFSFERKCSVSIVLTMSGNKKIASAF